LTREPRSVENHENPLAGVLDRLLQRERGHPVAPPTSAEKSRAPTEIARPAESTESPARRMLTVAALGVDQGDAALRSAGQWATVLGRLPSITDFCRRERNLPDRSGDERTPTGDGRVSRASLPCAPERIRGLPVEVALAVFEKLCRHESASELLIVRIPGRDRRTLMRATLLSGAVVVPVEESEVDFQEAVEIAREILRSFLDISIWPFSSNPRSMKRYLATIHQHCSTRIVPFDPGHLDLAAALDDLREPPHEGFLAGLLAPQPTSLPADILQIDSVTL